MTLARAAQLNFQGTRLLESRDYRAANRALCESAAIVGGLEIVEQEDLPELEAWEEAEASGEDEMETTATTAMSLSFGPDIPALKDHEFFIFNRCLLFQEEKVAAALPLSEEQKRLYAATVMINMAIGCHALAKEVGKDSHLRKALHLYGLSLDLLWDGPHREEEEEHEDEDDHDDCLDVLVIAALNNMANIHYQMGALPAAKQLLETAKPLLSDLSEEWADLFPVDECYLNYVVTSFSTTARSA